MLAEMNITDIAGQHHHNKYETGNHWSKIDLTGYSEKITVVVWKNKHHWDNSKKQVNIKPFICPINGTSIG